jgi:DNA-directed RNA polymerase sigma subunit (sigma70/sigma32)
LVDKIAKVRRVVMKITEELGREPTDEELAEEIGISSAKLSQLKRVSIRPASLDAPISHWSSLTSRSSAAEVDAARSSSEFKYNPTRGLPAFPIRRSMRHGPV